MLIPLSLVVDCAAAAVVRQLMKKVVKVIAPNSEGFVMILFI
jgi:hypothetical protein